MSSLRVVRVYLDIFLELLWSTHCIAKLDNLVRCIETSTNHLFQFLRFPMS
jgi:hypothetical protein